MTRVQYLSMLASLGVLLSAVTCSMSQVTQLASAPKESRLVLTVPRGDEPVVRLPPGHLVEPGSLHVYGKAGEFQLTEDTKPAKGQYRMLADGSLLLSTEDARQSISVRYRSVPARVAVLPVVNQSDIDYVAPATRTALDKALAAMGFEAIGDADVAAAMRAQGITFDAVTTAIGDPPTADQIACFARSLRASRVLLVVVGAGVRKGDAGYMAMGNLLLPISDERVSSSLALAVYDGRTGKLAFSKAKAASKDPGLGGNRAARTKVAQNLVHDLLYEQFSYNLD
jgi:hypothetical protein